MNWFDTLPFRLGTSSYIIPADILPNVRYLAGKVRDVEIILFDIDSYCNIPDKAQVAELSTLASAYGLTYTVHLPLNLRLSAEGGEADISLQKARKVIDATAPLSPFAYVLHLDHHDLPLTLMPDQESRWVDQSVKALRQLVPSVGDPALVAVENLESYSPALNHRVLEQIPVSECVDIGHLWIQKHDVLEYLRARLMRTRVIHWHGIGTRDHQSLIHAPQNEVFQILHLLSAQDYRGVLTLEVFSEDDFCSSLQLLGQIQGGFYDGSPLST